jgi:hypothetical protein
MTNDSGIFTGTTQLVFYNNSEQNWAQFCRSLSVTGRTSRSGFVRPFFFFCPFDPDPSVRSLMFPPRPMPSCDSPFFPQLFVCDTTPTCHSNITFFFGIINSLLYQNKNPVLQFRGLQQFCVSLNNFIGDCYTYNKLPKTCPPRNSFQNFSVSTMIIFLFIITEKARGGG